MSAPKREFEEAIIVVSGKKDLIAAVQGLDDYAPATIVLSHKHGITKYRFPARNPKDDPPRDCRKILARIRELPAAWLK